MRGSWGLVNRAAVNIFALVIHPAQALDFNHWKVPNMKPLAIAVLCILATVAQADLSGRVVVVADGDILHAAKFSVFENSWNFSVISVCIWLLKRVPRSRRQVSMLALKWAKVS